MRWVQQALNEFAIAPLTCCFLGVGVQPQVLHLSLCVVSSMASFDHQGGGGAGVHA